MPRSDDDDFSDEFSDDEPEAEKEIAPEAVIKLIPTLDHWQKNYGRSCEGNDQKAIRIFREYEPQERMRRLQNELMSIRERKVSEPVLDAVIGKKRMQKHQGYDKWAAMMLMWIAAKR